MNNSKKYTKIILSFLFTLSASLLLAMKMKYDQTGKAFVPETALVTGTIFLLAAIMMLVARYFIKKGETMPYNEAVKKVIPAIILFYIIAYLAAYFSVSFGVFVWFLIKGRDLHEYFPQLFKYELGGIKNGKLLGWLLFFTVAFFYALWQKSLKKEQKLREENLKYKYQNLKSQINPHFLFNSLNTLSEIIYEDTGKADTYIRTLSGIYRYILENEETDLIQLNKELEFVKQYFNLQKERNKDKIQLEIKLQDLINYRIIPVSLQILVENALKHNSRSETAPLKVRISGSNDYIEVSNNIQRKNILENSSKTGLVNLKERVKLILGKELIILEEKNTFIVKMPVFKG